MATVISTLYPPLVDTFQSPFVYTDDAEVFFTISPYNSYENIKKIHVTLVNQKTNQSVFASSSSQADADETVLTNGVWIVPFDISDNNPYLEGNHQNNYYILKIPSSLLKKTEGQEDFTYTCDCYYKVQIRFDSCTDEASDSSYLISKRSYFSEWSAVTLLKAIPKAEVKLTNFDINIGAITTATPQYTPGVIPITGTVSFDPQKTNEHLRFFNIEILDSAGNIVKESEKQFVEEDTNTFSWLCDLTNFSFGNYYIQLYLTTNNNYVITKEYSFKLIESSALEFNPIWIFNKITLPFTENQQTIVTSEDGWVTINIHVRNMLPAGYLFIKRASSIDKYLNWEIIDCKYFSNGATVDTTFIDKTVCSLVNYKYSCQYLTLGGLWSKTIKTNEIVYPDFYDSLILRGDKQLALRYNTQITNLTPVVGRVKIDTLGGKYPRFAENAKMHYKQFQINGLISAESDYNRKFIADWDYDEEINIYNKQMNGKSIIRNDTAIEDIFDSENHTWHNAYPTENWWWERKFREEVLEWLNDGEPKLYRSMTEGNMIVMFDSVSLTPNQQLGRRIWNFSATVYEVGDGYSLTDLSTLGIFPINNDFNADLYLKQRDENNRSNIKSWIGQKEHYIANNNDASNFIETINAPFKMKVQNNDNEEYEVLVPSLTEEIQNLYNNTYENYKIKKDSIYLTDVKFYFESEPKWYNLVSMNLKQNGNADLSISVGNKKYNFTYDDNLKQYVLKD